MRSLLLLLLGLWAGAASAHDPSAWGGIYRTRDAGATWLPADANLFIGAALGLAISPTDANHLLYATDTRLLRSRNGTRDWKPEAPQLFIGAVYATAFLEDGIVALAATPAGVFRVGADGDWQPATLPASAGPVRGFLAGAGERVYVAGSNGVYRSSDGGRSFTASRAGLVEAPVVALVAVQQPALAMLAVAGGGLYRSTDEGAVWTRMQAGLPTTVDTVVAQGADGGHLWLAGEDRLYRSGDAGLTWSPLPGSLPEPKTQVRGMGVAAGGQVLLLSTHRGVMRSADRGRTWVLGDGNLPVHLESGPLLADPSDASTFYASFSLTPYAELWRRASGSGSLMGPVDAFSLASGAAFLILLGMGSYSLVRWLAGPARLKRSRP